MTFEEKDGRTLLVLSNVYPTKGALYNAIEGMPETFAHLDDFLLSRRAGTGQH